MIDVSHKMHPRLANIDFYEGKLEKHANGCRVAKAPCTKYAAHAQKQNAKSKKPAASRPQTTMKVVVLRR